MQLRGDLLERLSAVQNKFNAYENELKKIDDGLAMIERATTTSEYSTGITQIATSEFSTAPIVAAASSIQSSDISDESTRLRYLLNITNESTWAYIQKQQSPNFIPDVVMPAEQQILQGA